MRLVNKATGEVSYQNFELPRWWKLTKSEKKLRQITRICHMNNRRGRRMNELRLIHLGQEREEALRLKRFEDQHTSAYQQFTKRIERADRRWTRRVADWFKSVVPAGEMY